VSKPAPSDPDQYGLRVDENQNNSLTYNGLEHTLLDTRLVFPSAHRLPERTNASHGEIQFYFRATYDPNIEYCLCIPIDVGGAGNPYFEGLSTSPNQRIQKVTLGSLTQDPSDYYQYLGADLRGRTSTTPRPDNRCDPVAKKVTYIVRETPALIHSNDYERLKSLTHGVNISPPTPSTPAQSQRILTLLTKLRSSSFTVIDPVNKLKRTNTAKMVPTSQVKCRRIDPAKDVINNQVYIGGKQRPRDSTLDQELLNAADLSKEFRVDEAAIQPGDVESWASTILGIIIGIVLCATTAYYVLKGTFKDYLPKVKTLYDKAIHPVNALSVKVPSLGIMDNFCGV
jgi:hypothetical protein